MPVFVRPATNARRFLVIVCALLALTTCGAGIAAACPFCAGVQPSLAMRRERAAVVALGEVVERGEGKVVYKLHVVQQGRELLGDAETVSIFSADERAAGALALLFVENAPDEGEPLVWKTTPVDEHSAAYFLRAPDLRAPVIERLPYFIPYLEHADRLLAEDAYREFGHAKYPEVAAVVGQISQEKIRAWLVDPAVPPERKGFYGLAAGLAADPVDRARSIELLRRLVLEPASDFRTGYDGFLGGYLVAAGEEALELIEERLLGNPEAANIDVRHAITALRFYHEFCREIPPERIQAAVRLLLDRPEFAQTVAVDLGRWQDWDSTPKVIEVLALPEYQDKTTRRMLIAFLLACPRDDAAEAVARFRQESPDDVAAAENYLAFIGAGQ